MIMQNIPSQKTKAKVVAPIALKNLHSDITNNTSHNQRLRVLDN